MRVLVLIDARNFEQGFFTLCNKRKEFRFIDFYKISSFIVSYLQNNTQYKNVPLTHLRTYFYTGEFTDKLLEKIEKSLSKDLNNPILKDLSARVKKDKERQSTFFSLAKNYYFFEIRPKPIQFSSTDFSIFQKGVDVQLAVDLVDFTHKDIFDIVVIMSGDIDLLESVKTAKGMGKHIIIFGESSTTSEEMKKYADLLVDIGRFNSAQLDEFSHIPNIKKDRKE